MRTIITSTHLHMDSIRRSNISVLFGCDFTDTTWNPKKQKYKNTNKFKIKTKN